MLSGNSNYKKCRYDTSHDTMILAPLRLRVVVARARCTLYVPLDGTPFGHVYYYAAHPFVGTVTRDFFNLFFHYWFLHLAKLFCIRLRVHEDSETPRSVHTGAELVSDAAHYCMYIVPYMCCPLLVQRHHTMLIFVCILYTVVRLVSFRLLNFKSPEYFTWFHVNFSHLNRLGLG